MNFKSPIGAKYMGYRDMCIAIPFLRSGEGVVLIAHSVDWAYPPSRLA